MYNNDDGVLKGHYVVRFKYFYIYMNGSYCRFEIQFGYSGGKYLALQLFTRVGNIIEWYTPNSRRPI